MGKKILIQIREDEALDLVQWMEKIIFLQRLDDPFEILTDLCRQLLRQLPKTEINPMGRGRFDMDTDMRIYNGKKATNEIRRLKRKTPKKEYPNRDIQVPSQAPKQNQAKENSQNSKA